MHAAPSIIGNQREAWRLAAQAAPAGSLQARFRTAPVKALQARDHLFFEGDARKTVYLIEIGAVCLYRTLADGRRQIFGFALSGDFVGLHNCDVQSCSAQALGLTRVRCIPAGSLKEVGRSDPQLGLQLYETVSEQLMAARDLLSTVGQRSAVERLASLLVAMSRRNARNGEDQRLINLPMTRSDIADFLSLTIETVSRTFTRFRQDDLIELTHNTHVRILNLPALEGLAAGEDTPAAFQSLAERI